MRPKLTPDEMNSCKGTISVKEFLDALKAMGDGKSPGMDGFTVEFYKKNLEGHQPLFSAVNQFFIYNW